MTFEEWWEKTEKDEEIKNREVIYKNLAELLAHDAWKTAQKQQFVSDESAKPKWTYCKDRYPTEVDGEVKKGCIGFRKNLRLVGVIGLSRDSDFGFEVTFNLTENHFESDDREVIAWMPLPDGNNANG